MIQNLAIIGVGLIGGSLALSLKAAGFTGKIYGYDQNQQALKRALELGVIDHIVADEAEAAEAGELVVLAVPMLAMEAVLKSLAKTLDDKTMVSDVGSVKGSFANSARKYLSASQLKNFIPGHPIAGTEHSGVESAFASLYQGRRVILTPLEETLPATVQEARQLWECAGALVECLDIKVHDRVLAETSHLPHVLAFGLVDALARLPDHEDIFKYAAGGFRDFTRIASSDPTMWRDVCLTNRDALLEVMSRYRKDLDLLSTMISTADGDGLHEIFSRAKQARDKHGLG